MKPKNFEEFLHEEYFNSRDMILDDVEQWEDWLSDLDVDQWIQLGDKYGKVLNETQTGA